MARHGSALPLLLVLLGCSTEAPSPTPPAIAGAPHSATGGQPGQAGGHVAVAGTPSVSGAGSVPATGGTDGTGQPPEPEPEPEPEPDPVLVLNPAPSKTYVVVTAGQSNAGLRIDDGGLAADWDHPLDTKQNPVIEKTLGALAVRDSGDRYGGELNTAVGGCGLIRSMDGCYFVDDTSSSDPAAWTLQSWGKNLAANLSANKAMGEVVFVSWVQGEANAHSIAADPTDLPGSVAHGGPYDYQSREQWAAHYQQALVRFVQLLREASGLPKLRFGIQLIASYDGFPDLIRQAQLDAIAASEGALVLENANPWQWYRPLSSEDGAHYNGQAYADFCLETGRSLAFELRKAGNVDSAVGPGYGRFPAITKTSVSGSSIDVTISNPNAASTLLLPTQNVLRGWGVVDQGNALDVTGVSLAAPFTIRLSVAGSPSPSARVTYGTESNHSAPGEAVTDDAASAGPADAVPVERRNMPLTVKPF